MIKYECIIPQIDVNDKKVSVNNFRFTDGSYVNRLDVILTLETAKAVSDFYSEESGYIAYCVEEGDDILIGDKVALIFDDSAEAVTYAQNLKTERERNAPKYLATAKAEKLAIELEIDISQIPKNGIIKEIDVQNYYQQTKDKQK